MAHSVPSNCSQKDPVLLQRALIQLWTVCYTIAPAQRLKNYTIVLTVFIWIIHLKMKIVSYSHSCCSKGPVSWFFQGQKCFLDVANEHVHSRTNTHTHSGKYPTHLHCKPVLTINPKQMQRNSFVILTYSIYPWKDSS